MTGEDSLKADSHTYDKGYKKWEKFDVPSATKNTSIAFLSECIWKQLLQEKGK